MHRVLFGLGSSRRTRIGAVIDVFPASGRHYNGLIVSNLLLYRHYFCVKENYGIESTGCNRFCFDPLAQAKGSARTTTKTNARTQRSAITFIL